MQFGDRERFAIECEITDRTRPYFFGRFRIWIDGRAHGDFSAEIISTYVIYLSQIVKECQDGEVDCSGRLPYMENLRWRVSSHETGDELTAGLRGEEMRTVLLRRAEFREISEQFFDWVFSHPDFTAVERSEVFIAGSGAC